MSAKLVGRALDIVEGITAAEKLVLIALADSTNSQTFLCFPSMRWIAERVPNHLGEQITERHARRLVRSLANKGLIDITERPGRSSIYHVLPQPDPGPAGQAPPRTYGSAPPRTSDALAPDLQMSGAPDLQMSAVPERTEGNRDESQNPSVDNVKHHFCFPSKGWVDTAKSDCPECGTAELLTEGTGTQ